MTWEMFYLVCFLVGFLLSVISAFSGSFHLHLHAGHFHGPHFGGKGTAASPLNMGTISAFLAWFGGAGYLLTRYSSVWIFAALGLALLTGLAGAALVFWILFKVLLKHEQDLDPADYRMVGVLGTLSSPIRENGVGEIIFSQAGSRRCASARSEDGRPIPRGAEVVVTQYERGIALVRRWEEINAESSTQRSLAPRS